MSAATQPRLPPGLVLDNVSWRDFKRWLRLLDGRPSLRVSYDRRILEITTLTFSHESIGRFLDRLVTLLTEELTLPIAGGGSTTFFRRPKRKGLEPDQCYWIAHESAVRGKARIDLRADPPPDLAVEVDVTHSSLDRMGIYAALGVPEVWRWQQSGLTFQVLQPNGQYAPATSSLAFAGLGPGDLEQFVHLRAQLEENQIMRQFRTWIRQHFGIQPVP